MTDKEILRLITIKMGVQGSKEAVQHVRAVFNAVKDAIQANTNLATSTRSLTKLIEDQSNAYAKSNKFALQFIKSQEKLATTFSNLSKSANAFFGVFSKISNLVDGENIGFAVGYKYLINYNKELLKTTGQFSKYGLGITAVQSSMMRLQKATGLTSKEAMNLLSTYEEGFPKASFEEGEAILKNIKNITGGNADAMRDYLGVVSSLINKYPELEDAAKMANESDKMRLRQGNMLAFLAGKQNLAEFKRFQNYVNGSKQTLTADQEKQKALQDSIDATNKLRQAFEKIAREIGEFLTPIVNKVASLVDYFQLGTKGLGSWLPILASISIAMKGMGAASGFMNFANKTGMGNNAMSKAIGSISPFAGRFLGGGVAGGLAGSAVESLTSSSGMDKSSPNLSKIASYASTMAAGFAVGGPVGMAASTLQLIYKEVSRVTDIFTSADEGNQKVTDRSNAYSGKLGSQLEAAQKSGDKDAEWLVAKRLEIEKLRKKQRELDVMGDKKGFFGSIFGGNEQSAEQKSWKNKAAQYGADAQSIEKEINDKRAKSGGSLPAEKKMEEQVAAAKKLQAELDNIDKLQGDVAAKINEQEITLQAVGNYYNAQAGQLEAIAGKIALTGKNNGEIEAAVAATLTSYDRQIVATEKMIKLREDAIQLAERQVAVTTDEETKQKLIKEISAARLDADAKSIELQKIKTQKTQIELSAIEKIANQNAMNVTRMASQANKAEALINLYDSMGAGLSASADMRMKAAEATGRQIEEEQKSLKYLDDAIAEANKHQLDTTSLQNQRIEKETTILNLQQKQAQGLKAIRDGYINAISAMTAGSGMFAKIMIDQNKNMGVGLKYLGTVQSMTSGGVSGGRSVGGRDNVSFSATGGISGQTAAGSSRMWDTYNGGGKTAGSVQDMQRKIQQSIGAVRSGAAGAAGASPYLPGAIMQGGGGSGGGGQPKAVSVGGGAGGGTSMPIVINVNMDKINALPGMIRAAVDSHMQKTVGSGSLTSLNSDLAYNA